MIGRRNEAELDLGHLLEYLGVLIFMAVIFTAICLLENARVQRAKAAAEEARQAIEEAHP